MSDWYSSRPSMSSCSPARSSWTPTTIGKRTGLASVSPFRSSSARTYCCCETVNSRVLRLWLMCSPRKKVGGPMSLEANASMIWAFNSSMSACRAAARRKSSTYTKRKVRRPSAWSR